MLFIFVCFEQHDLIVFINFFLYLKLNVNVKKALAVSSKQLAADSWLSYMEFHNMKCDILENLIFIKFEPIPIEKT